MTVTLDYMPIRVIAHAKRTLDHRQQRKKNEFRPPRAAHGLKMRSSQQAQNECHTRSVLERSLLSVIHASSALATPQAHAARVRATIGALGAPH